METMGTMLKRKCEKEKRCAVVFLTRLQRCVCRRPYVFYAAPVFEREGHTPSPTPTLRLEGQMPVSASDHSYWSRREQVIEADSETQRKAIFPTARMGSLALTGLFPSLK